MTNFAEYWASLTRGNPGLADPESQLRISVDSFRKQLERAFTAGQDSVPVDRSVVAKAFENIGRKKPTMTSDDMFDDFFRGLKT